MGHNAVGGHIFQVKLQAARQDRGRQFLRIGRRQQEFDMGRRLFEGFQQGIKAVARQHMHLIDEIHLVAPAAGRVLHIFEQLAGIFNLGARCSIDFDEVDKTSLCNFHTRRTGATGLRADALLAVQAFSEDAGDSSFTHAAGTGKQIGVMQAIPIKGIDQRLEHMLLPDQLLDARWPPFTR